MNQQNLNEKEFDNFTKSLETCLHANLEENMKIDIHKTTKNNGIYYWGLTIVSPEDNITPNIRIENFYEEYRKGISITDIAKRVIEIYNESKQEPLPYLDFFTKFENAKEHIMFRLVGFEKNEEQLKNIPYIRYLDLAVVFYYYLDVKIQNGEHASILIEKHHLEQWNVDEKKLYEIAMINTQRKMEVQCRTIQDVIFDIIKKDDDTSCSVPDLFDNADHQMDMYVLTNKSNYYGASVIYYPNLLQKFADFFHKDLIILPSSIHEVIFLLANGDEDYASMNAMVNEINEDQVVEEEVLSNHVYYYSRENKMLSIPINYNVSHS